MVNNPEKYIDRYFPVLDHGAVALTGYLGGDDTIEQFARVSYGKGTRKKTKTRGLIRYLMRHRHTTPFESTELSFHVVLPLFVARQFIRHRTFSFNEYSGRYSVMPKAYYIPTEERFGGQSKSNRQGTDTNAEIGMSYEKFAEEIRQNSERDFHMYDRYIESGVARELARIKLPLNAYTEWYCSVDLHNLFHFLGLRMDPHAQWEIREYANVMAGLTQAVAPLAFEAFIDYHLNCCTFSTAEVLALRHICQGGRVNEEELRDLGMSNREVEEFKDAMFGSRDVASPQQYELNPDDALTAEQARQRLHGE